MVGVHHIIHDFVYIHHLYIVTYTLHAYTCINVTITRVRGMGGYGGQ